MTGAGGPVGQDVKTDGGGRRGGKKGEEERRMASLDRGSGRLTLECCHRHCTKTASDPQQLDEMHALISARFVRLRLSRVTVLQPRACMEAHFKICCFAP